MNIYISPDIAPLPQGQINPIEIRKNLMESIYKWWYYELGGDVEPEGRNWDEVIIPDWIAEKIAILGEMGYKFDLKSCSCYFNRY